MCTRQLKSLRWSIRCFQKVTSLSEKQIGYARQLETLSKEFTELKTQLSIQDSRSDFRPQATGSGNHNENLTNC
jgi:hypothetical protein